MPLFPRVGDVFGRYRIDRRVALKVVSAALGGSAEFLVRFEREAALLARLNSPHVIAIFDYGERDGCPYLATQYVGGGDLGALIAARGRMPPKLAVEVCAQVADALADAHRAGVVHRDVKPTNVLLRDADTLDLHAYLCDFGIARTDGEGLTAPAAPTSCTCSSPTRRRRGCGSSPRRARRSSSGANRSGCRTRPGS
ncbi:MAG: serine/threonine-protein kinase [Nocardioides sp.]|nr:serine/threonine-protein kinase [Nocardioides sp.]